MTTNWSDADLQCHLEDDIQNGAFEMNQDVWSIWGVTTPDGVIDGHVTSWDYSTNTGIAMVGYDALVDVYFAEGKLILGNPEWIDDSEERMERQAQAHLEATALHRDDPMF